jgi:hypothetical protein
MNVDNKLIAEFLGYETYEMNGVLNVEYSEDNIRTIQDTHYHKDWNWLMQVIEKIETLGYNTKIESLEHTRVSIGNGKLYTLIQVDKEIKIQAVYNACVEFIKWYNEQNFNI